MLVGLDDIDRTILDVLQSDGRITNNDLADQVGLSPSACLRRVRRLEEDGVIASYAAIVDPSVIGRPTTVFVEISLESQEESRLDAFEAVIGDIPEVLTCHLMTGDFDYLVRLACADVADYERIHRTQLAILPGVTRVKTSFSLRTVLNQTAMELAAPE